MPNRQPWHWGWCKKATAPANSWPWVIGPDLRKRRSSLLLSLLGGISEINALLLSVLWQASFTGWKSCSVILGESRRAEGTTGRKMEGITPSGRAKAGRDVVPGDNGGEHPCLCTWVVVHWFKPCKLVRPNVVLLGSFFATKLAKPVNEQP